MTTQLTEKKLEKVVERAVARVLRQALSDPDFGHELRPEFEKSLKRSIASGKSKKLKSLDDVLFHIK